MNYLVILESPYAGDIEANVAYARRAVRDSLMRGEAPMARLLLYTQQGILDDSDPDDRALGMEACWAWIDVADYMVVYADKGITVGMRNGINEAEASLLTIEYRYMDGKPSAAAICKKPPTLFPF